MRACLTVESGLASPRVSELAAETRLRLGRNRDNELILQGRHASRFHAELYCRGDQWYLADQETTNGTRLDGEPVRGETPLRHNQVVSVGDVRLRFTLVQGAEEPTAEAEPLP